MRHLTRGVSVFDSVLLVLQHDLLLLLFFGDRYFHHLVEFPGDRRFVMLAFARGGFVGHGRDAGIESDGAFDQFWC